MISIMEVQKSEVVHRKTKRRRGIATLWLVASGVVMALLVIVVTDAARLYLARIEIQNALDAAALSAVKTRCQTGVSGANDLAARMDGREAYLSNFPSITVPTSTAMSTNEGGAGANGNLRCPPVGCPDGIVLLGSIYFPATGTPSELVFDADTAPNKAQVLVRADSADTFGDPDTFSVTFSGTSPANLQSLTINLANAGSEFDPGLGLLDLDGYGPFPAAPLPPIAGYSLTAISPSSPTLTVTFDGSLVAGTSASFGLDTDISGSAASSQSSASLAGAVVSIVMSDGVTLSGPLTADGTGAVEATFVVGASECAVQVHGCVEVESIAPMFLGEIFGPYPVHAKATAWFRCQGPDPEPELVRVDRTVCTP